ncbi:InlB B-repeat-containing protein [Parabacteroides sp. OttesenSCG-928-N08]|nr:InlB B-repeat-containing protein [Parabacteroides sp. OttesenSCG-928-N08]
MKQLSFFTVILFVIAMLSPSAMAQAKASWTDVGVPDTEWYTKSDPIETVFEISTPKQLAGVAELVNKGTTTFAGCTIKLTKDINLKGKQWVPIGNWQLDTFFEGSLYGQGHTIKGLTIDNYSSEEEYAYIGLIGRGSGDVTIKDITLSEVTIGEVKADFTYTGAFIGEFWGNSLTLSSCHTASGSVVGGEMPYSCLTGGLVGYIGGSIINVSNCSNKLKVTGGKQTTNANGTGVTTGGIVGLIEGTMPSIFQACVNYGEVIGGDAPFFTSYTGGVVGRMSRVSLSDCYNTGDVTAGNDVGVSNNTGGIVGKCEGSSITNCYASGKLIGGKKGSSIRTGGIVGVATDSHITYCLAIQSEISGKGNSYRIIGGLTRGGLSHNYAFVPGNWDQTDEIGADKLNGAEWTGRMDKAPIDSWSSSSWIIDPSYKKLPKLKWEKGFSISNPFSFYYVTLITNGGNYDSKILCADLNKPIDSPAAPTKDNYAFIGWYIDSECTTLWDFNDPVTGDMTLYAKWTPTLSSDAASFDMIATQVANGKPLTPKVTVRWFNEILTEGTDYTIAYFDNIHPGTGHARITGKGNYTGKLDAYFVIIDPMVVFSLDINEVEGITTNPAAGRSWLQKGLHRDLEIIADPKYNLDNAEVYLNDQLIYPNEEAGYPFTRVIDGLTIRLGAITENTVIRIEGIALKTPEELLTGTDALASDFRVTPLSGAVRIDARAATRVQIYRTNGSLTAIQSIGEGTTIIPLPADIYLIRMEERTWKVVIKE